jgi:hypothetical protein
VIDLSEFKPRIRGFTHAEDEFEDEYELRDWLDKELRINLRGCYHLREARGLGWSPDALPPGSIVLFHFKGKIVGEGVVEKGVQKIDEEHRRKEELGPQYKFFVKFKPELIRAYPSCELPLGTAVQAIFQPLPFFTTSSSMFYISLSDLCP